MALSRRSIIHLTGRTSLLGRSAGSNCSESWLGSTLSSLRDDAVMPQACRGGDASFINSDPSAAQKCGQSRSFSFGGMLGLPGRSFASIPFRGHQESAAPLNGPSADLKDVADSGFVEDDQVPLAEAVLNAVTQSEDAALTAAVESSWWSTGVLMKGLCGATEILGVPWWVSIAAFTAAVRLAIFPFMVQMEKTKEKLTLIKPEAERIQAKYNPSIMAGDKEASEAFRSETYALYAKHNMSPMAAMTMLPVTVTQVFVFGTFFFSLQSLSHAKLPSMMTGGTAWFTDLTVPDATFLLPSLGAGLMLAMVELNATDMGSSGTSGAMKNFMRLFSVAFLVMGAYFPSGLFVYFCTANAFTLAQSSVLKAPRFRQLVGLPEVTSKPLLPSESLTDMYKRVASKIDASGGHPSQEAVVKTYAMKSKKRKGGKST